LAKQTRTTMHPRHKVSLTEIGGIIAEQGRIYRLWLNGKLKSGEMTRAMFGLREIRCSIEALPPEPQLQPAYRAPVINLVEVPSGMFLSEAEMRRSAGLPPIHTIEHQPENRAFEFEPEPPEPAHAPIVEPPLTRAPENVRDGTVVNHGIHLVYQQDQKTSRETLEDRLAAMPDKMLRALAGVDDADES
jgi:hypothetical protein